MCATELHQRTYIVCFYHYYSISLKNSIEIWVCNVFWTINRHCPIFKDNFLKTLRPFKIR